MPLLHLLHSCFIGFLLRESLVFLLLLLLELLPFLFLLCELFVLLLLVLLVQLLVPCITFARTERLLIDRQRGRGKGNDDAHADLCKRCRRHAPHDEREQEPTQGTDMHGDSSGPSSLVYPVLLSCCRFRGFRARLPGRAKGNRTISDFPFFDSLELVLWLLALQLGD